MKAALITIAFFGVAVQLWAADQRPGIVNVGVAITLGAAVLYLTLTRDA